MYNKYTVLNDKNCDRKPGAVTPQKTARAEGAVLDAYCWKLVTDHLCTGYVFGYAVFYVTANTPSA